ncbi:MAG TPA: VWA domain-containing protein [Saprospiraceae bacterium]|nr:VWA domain-containing protein [Saprospiraceae bacterium]
MMGITIERPEFLLLLLIVPILGFFLNRWKNSRQKRAFRFANKNVLQKLTNNPVHFKDRSSSIVLTAFSLIILALANPQLPGKPDKVTKKSADIIFAFDVSKSMLSQDVSPDRLTRAKLWATELIKSMPNQRIGLVVFAGTGYVYMPLTNDANAAIEFINGISTEMASYQGTAIGDAISAVQQAFSNVAEKNKGLILITDGEDHDSNALKAAYTAANQGIVITTIGVGSEKGGMIPELSDDGMHFKMDENGQPVRSKLNIKILQEIAAATQGKYFNLDHPKNASQGVEQMIQGLDKGIYDTQDTSNNTSLYLFFLLPAFILFLFEFFKNRIPRRSPKNIRQIGLSSFVFIILFISPDTIPAQSARKLLNEGNKAYRAKDFETAKQKYGQSAQKQRNFNNVYNEANALYKLGKYPEAAEKNMEAFGLAKTPEQKSISAFNLGNSFYQSKDYSKAIDAYKQALRNNPADLDSKENLTKALTMQQQQNQQNKDKNKENKDNQDNQDKNNQNKKQNQPQNNQNGNQSGDSKSPSGQESNQQQQSGKLSQQEAENLLRIMKEEEKNTRAKVMKQGQQNPIHNGKDW